jgi:hypothetical protein
VAAVRRFWTSVAGHQSLTPDVDERAPHLDRAGIEIDVSSLKRDHLTKPKAPTESGRS